jgi:predicted small secreted protein
MKERTLLVAVVLLASLVLAGCASTDGAKDDSKAMSKSESPDAGAKKPDKDPAAERKDLERKIEIAELKLEQAETEAETHESTAAAAVDSAKEELEIARSKLAEFQEFDSPTKLGRAQLSLQSARDMTEEANEELAQLEIMYEEQDLEDRTREFVINRGKRNAERRARMLELETQSLESLEKYELPRELATLKLDIVRKELAVDKAVRDMRSGRLQKKIALISARGELEDLKEKLAKLDEKKEEKK